MATIFKINYDEDSDSSDDYEYDDYEHNYRQRHAQGLCPCAGSTNGQYIKNRECINYQHYGYNCVGIRVELDGRILSAPYGFGEKEYEVGPDFGDNYAETHPDEFEGVVLKKGYNPEEHIEYSDDTEDVSNEYDLCDSMESNDNHYDGYDSA